MRSTSATATLAILFGGWATPDRPGAIARRRMAMWAAGATAGLEAIATPDVVHDDVPDGARFEGRDGIRRYVGRVHARAGDVRIDVTRGRSGSDGAVAEWVMRGVQDRPIPGRVPVATKRAFELTGATLVEPRDGRIARAADDLDVLGFGVQLGGRVELPGKRHDSTGRGRRRAERCRRHGHAAPLNDASSRIQGNPRSPDRRTE